MGFFHLRRSHCNFSHVSRGISDMFVGYVEIQNIVNIYLNDLGSWSAVSRGRFGTVAMVSNVPERFRQCTF